jgi:hypothetical protein
MLAGENTEIPVWMAEADHCMIHRAMGALDDAADEGPLTICKVRAILADIADEWPECGDISQHQLEMVPRSHVQLLWLLGACRDPETGVPHVAPDGHLVCLFEKLRAQARTALTPSTPEERQHRQDLSIWQRGQQRFQRARTAGHAAAAASSMKAAARAAQQVGGLQKAVGARQAMVDEAAGRTAGAGKKRQLHAEVAGWEGGFGPSTGAAYVGQVATHQGAKAAEGLQRSLLQRSTRRLKQTEQQSQRHLQDVARSVAMRDITAAISNATQKIRQQGRDLAASVAQEQKRLEGEAKAAADRVAALRKEAQDAPRRVQDALTRLGRKSDRHRLDLWISNRLSNLTPAMLGDEHTAAIQGERIAQDLVEELEGVSIQTNGMGARMPTFKKGARMPTFKKGARMPTVRKGARTLTPRKGAPLALGLGEIHAPTVGGFNPPIQEVPLSPGESLTMTTPKT